MRSAHLTAETISQALTTKRIGSQVYCYEEIGSTNNEAKRLAREGCPDGTLVIANEQHGGRGRLARSFLSPKGGGLWFTLVLRPNIAPTEASKCTLLAALAVAKAVRKTTNIDCGIKWPNDILVNGKKLVGILTEMSADMDGVKYIVCGIGINVNIRREEFPSELQSIATSVEAELGRSFDRLVLLDAVCSETERIYEEMLREGFAPILDEWKQYSVTLGQAVRVIAPDETYEGVAIDLDEDGSLLVQTETEIKTVLAGDVSIRPQEH